MTIVVSGIRIELHAMRGTRKFCQRKSTLTTFFVLFLVDEGMREDPNNTLSRPSSARH